MKRLSQLAITPNIAFKTISGIVVLGVVSYFVWLVLPIFRSPALMVFEPEGNNIVSGPDIMLRGATDAGTRLTVNREEVYVDENGNFSQPLALVSGVNIIEFTVEGRFGRKTKLTRYIILKS